jgi:hypothetical protein
MLVMVDLVVQSLQQNSSSDSSVASLGHMLTSLGQRLLTNQGLQSQAVVLDQWFALLLSSQNESYPRKRANDHPWEKTCNDTRFSLRRQVSY